MAHVNPSINKKIIRTRLGDVVYIFYKSAGDGVIIILTEGWLLATSSSVIEASLSIYDCTRRCSLGYNIKS